MGELDELWRDDRLIEALARRQPPPAADHDPVVGPLRALAEAVDRPDLPAYDVHQAAAVAHRNRRYAARSLAVAVTAVATLSTSGVAAVVTGDPFRPATAVWQQIKDHTPVGEERTSGSGAGALGAVRHAYTAPGGDAGARAGAEPANVRAAGRDDASALDAGAGPEARDTRTAAEQRSGTLAGGSAQADAVGPDGDARGAMGPDSSGRQAATEESAGGDSDTASDEDASESTTSSDEQRERAREDDRRTDDSDSTAEDDLPGTDSDEPAGDDRDGDDTESDDTEGDEETEDPGDEPDSSEETPIDPPTLTRAGQEPTDAPTSAVERLAPTDATAQTDATFPTDATAPADATQVE